MRWCREAYVERRPFTSDPAAFHPDRPMHHCGERTAKVQSQPVAHDVRSKVAWQPDEALEEQRNLLRRDAEAIVTHHELDHGLPLPLPLDRKSTRLNFSHANISYA